MTNILHYEHKEITEGEHVLFLISIALKLTALFLSAGEEKVNIGVNVDGAPDTLRLLNLCFKEGFEV